MLFVTVGTTDFEELVRTMDQIAAKLDERVVAQIGKGDYIPAHMEHFRFAPSLDPYLNQARIVITHGGLGTIAEVLQKRCKIIGVNNPDRYDLHQEELLKILEEQGHIIWCRRLSHLAESLQKAEGRILIPYSKPRCNIAEVIRNYLKILT